VLGKSSRQVHTPLGESLKPAIVVDQRKSSATESYLKYLSSQEDIDW
jgi:hypothetical protein